MLKLRLPEKEIGIKRLVRFSPYLSGAFTRSTLSFAPLEGGWTYPDVGQGSLLFCSGDYYRDLVAHVTRRVVRVRRVDDFDFEFPEAAGGANVEQGERH